MTIDLRPPHSGEERALRSLFTEAFGDEDFTDLFFRHGFSSDRCLCAYGSSLLAALHWFDCSLDGRKAAYIYGIAALEAYRGQGIGSALIRFAIEHLKTRGYAVIALVPAERELFSYYTRFGFRPVSTIREACVNAGDPLPVRALTAGEYADLRRAYLSEHSLIQEGEILDLLSGYASFYATPHAIAAVSGSMVWELLGDEADAPGLIAALNLPAATVRTPGAGRPFAMAMGAEPPLYLGLALD